MNNQLFWQNQLICIGSVIFFAVPAVAQITPDNTLGTEASRITPNQFIKGGNADRIDGGALRGGNLFHSFSQFNIQEGQRVFFRNPPGVEHILTRVTGNNSSDIFGTLGVEGNANLFLINPTGLYFGRNARLDLGGSFVGTTANAIEFSQQGLFSATNPETVPLLTVNPSALFFNNRPNNQPNGQFNNQGNITNLARQRGLNGETNVTGRPVGLQVPDGKSLALVGGNVLLDDGNLSAFGGRIEIGSVAGTGKVNLDTTQDSFIFNYDAVDDFGEIRLENVAIVDVTGGGGGDIVVNSDNLDLDDSNLIAGIKSGQGTVNSQAGSILINSENIKFDNTSVIFNIVRENGVGNSGNIQINANNILIDNQSVILSTTEGLGNAGDIIVNSFNITMNNTSVMNSGIEPGANGKGGDIKIQTNRLSLLNGSQINSIIYRQSKDSQGNIVPAGNGNTGNLRITVSESITLAGTGKDGFSSAFFTFAERGTSGSAGDIFVETNNLQIKDGAIIGATTANDSDAGNIFINAKNIDVINGGQVVSATRSQGNAGTINFTYPRGKITISGVDPNFQEELNRARQFIENNPTERFETVSDIVVNEGAESGIFSNATASSTGDGGAINIQANSLLVSDRAQISTQNQGTGIAGNIEIKSPRVTFDNQGKLIAESVSGNGGNANLQIDNLLLLRRNSQISTNAGTAQTGGDGGNINFNDGLIVAIPQEDSNITANAFTGRGGNIEIKTEGIFGIQPASVETPESDITASSELGIQGEITITEPDVDPAQGTIELPAGLEDKSDQIGAVCPRGADAAEKIGEFTVTGRGGLPPSPLEALAGNGYFPQLATFPGDRETRISPSISRDQQDIAPRKIVEATGFVKGADGTIHLVAKDAAKTPASFTSQGNCPV